MTDQSASQNSKTAVPSDGDAKDSWDQALAAAYSAGGEPPAAAGQSILAALSDYFGRLPKITLRRPAEGEVIHLSPTETGSPPHGTGRFHLYGEIGRGGMGAIYLGRDGDLGRDLAVKVLLESHQHKPELGRRFLYEAQVAGQLEHPAIPPVYELGRLTDGRPFFAMKLVRGKTFAALLAERKSPADDLPRHLDVLTQVCQAMAYAHSRGVIHRDLKPSNIMVGAFGEVQLMDWGLAKVLPQGGTSDDRQHTSDDATVHWSPGEAHGDTDRLEASNTRAGSVVGTPPYMSPEQARGEVDALDERSDVFSLGAILCEILTGKPPYCGNNVTAIRDQAAQGDQAEARKRLFECSADRELVPLAEACLAPIPGERLRNASELAERLTRYRQSVEKRLRDAELATAAAQAKAVEERRRRRLSLALTFVLIAVVAFAVGGGTWWYQQRQQMIDDVESALADAAEYRKAERWEGVHAVLQRASGRLGNGGPLSLRHQVDQAKKDAEMVLTLENIREMPSQFVRDQKFDYAPVLERCKAEFIGYGIDPTHGPATDVAVRIQHSAIKRELIAALDDWIYAATRDQPQLATNLKEVRNLADDDAFRTKLRTAIRAGDRETMRSIIGGEEIFAQRPQYLLYLSQSVGDMLGETEEIDFLRNALRRYPDDFFLNNELGFRLQKASKPNPSEALGFYRAAIAGRPSSPGAYLNLGSVLSDLNRYDEAIKCFERAVELKPDYVGARSWIGHVLSKRGDVNGALVCFKGVVKDFPESPNAEFDLGKCYDQMRRYPDAIRHYERAIEFKPDHVEALVNVGHMYLAQKDFLKAKASIQKAIDIRPTFANAHNSLGVVLKAEGDLDGAIRSFQRGISLDPKDARLCNNLAGSFLKRGLPDEALKWSTKAIELDSAKADHYLRHSHILASSQKWADAILSAKRAVELAPTDGDARTSLGEYYMHSGKLEEAEVCFRRGIDLGGPDLALAFDNLGCVLRMRGKPVEAIAFHRKALTLDSARTDLYYDLGVTLEAAGDERGSITEYRRAIELDGKNGPALFHLSRVISRSGDQVEAEVLMRRAIEVAPPLPEWKGKAYNTLGAILSNQQKSDEALVWIRKAIDVNPKNALAHRNLGAVLRNLGRYEESLAAFETARAVFSEQREAAPLIDQDIQITKRLLESDRRLTTFVESQELPTDPQKGVGLAELTYHKKRFRLSEQIYSRLFEQPEFAEELESRHRYNAACAAALAAIGMGGDSKELASEQRRELRQKCLAWLKDDLAARKKAAEEGDEKVKLAMAMHLAHALKDSDLASVRDAELLAKLPEGL